MYNYYAVVGSAAPAPEAHGEGGGEGLAFNLGTFGFSILNIIVLFVLLKLILFKPVTNMMNARTEKIKKNIADAENNRTESDKLKAQYKEQLDNLKAEAGTIINDAHQKAQAEAEELLKKAKKEAELIIQKAKEQGEREVQQALENVKNQVASIALQAASKVIQKNMDTETNKKLVEDFINEVGAA